MRSKLNSRAFYFRLDNTELVLISPQAISFICIFVLENQIITINTKHIHLIPSLKLRTKF